MEKKLAIVVSHPIQYYAPLFAVLATEINLKVFYCHNPSAEEIGVDGFGKAFTWDVDLLSGYEYEFLENVSKNPSVSLMDGCDTPDVGERLKAYGATHVVAFGWYLKSLLQTLKYCNENGIPIAARGDSQLDPQQSFLKRIAKKIYYPFFLNKYNAFLSVGDRNKKYLLNYGVKSSKIIFSPHAVNQEFWKGDPVPQNAFTFIWVAKFIDKKRPLDCIVAFKEVVKKYPNVKLKMIGAGNMLNKAQQLASGVSQISFLGFKNQTELKEIYLSSDCLILTSDYGETWGLVVNEGFAAGIPAIVSSACGCVDDLINEGTGLMYNFGNIDELKMSLINMITYLTTPLNRQKVQKEIAAKNNRYSFNFNIESFKKFTSQF